MKSQFPIPNSQIPNPKSPTAFTLIELLVVIAIIAILAGIIQPMASVSASKTREAKCEANLRQISVGLHAYAEDYDAFPPDMKALDSTLQDRSLLNCPGAGTEYVYLSPPNSAARDDVVVSCVRPEKPGRWPHRFGTCYMELSAGGEVRRVIGKQARR